MPEPGPVQTASSESIRRGHLPPLGQIRASPTQADTSLVNSTALSNATPRSASRYPRIAIACGSSWLPRRIAVCPTAFTAQIILEVSTFDGVKEHGHVPLIEREMIVLVQYKIRIYVMPFEDLTQ